jgi:hypothetical protein
VQDALRETAVDRRACDKPDDCRQDQDQQGVKTPAEDVERLWVEEECHADQANGFADQDR